MALPIPSQERRIVPSDKAQGLRVREPLLVAKVRMLFPELLCTTTQRDVRHESCCTGAQRHVAGAQAAESDCPLSHMSGAAASLTALRL